MFSSFYVSFYLFIYLFIYWFVNLLLVTFFSDLPETGTPVSVAVGGTINCCYYCYILLLFYIIIDIYNYCYILLYIMIVIYCYILFYYYCYILLFIIIVIYYYIIIVYIIVLLLLYIIIIYYCYLLLLLLLLLLLILVVVRVVLVVIVLSSVPLVPVSWDYSPINHCGSSTNIYCEVFLATTAKENKKNYTYDDGALHTFSALFFNINMSILDDVGQVIVSVSKEAAYSCENS